MSASPTGLRLQSDMPVMFASLPHPEGVIVHQAAGVTAEGWVPGRGGPAVGGLKMRTHPPILSAGERYEKWDDCSYDDGGGGGSPDNRREWVAEFGAGVAGGGGGGGGGCQSRKIQFLQLYCSVCHHSLSRLNTRAE